ncbi:hypothetical protein ACVWYN_002696 [Pedobacter sp. UYP24]
MYSPEILQEVTDFAYKYLLIAEIAIITGVEIDDLKDKLHPVHQAFLKGRYMRKAEYNSSVIALSKQLSSPAMAIESKIAETAFLNDHKTL